jgi:hypothetical protein
MPRRPVPPRYANEEDAMRTLYRESYGIHVYRLAEAYRAAIRRSRTLKRKELRGPARKLDRGEAGAIPEVLNALRELSHDDRRVREAYLRWSIRHRDLVNELGLNDGPTDDDPNGGDRNVGRVDVPAWFVDANLPVFGTEKPRRGRPRKLRPPVANPYAAVQTASTLVLAALVQLVRSNGPGFDMIGPVAEPFRVVIQIPETGVRPDPVESLRAYLRSLSPPDLEARLTREFEKAVDREIEQLALAAREGERIRRMLRGLAKRFVEYALNATAPKNPRTA